MASADVEMKPAEQKAEEKVEEKAEEAAEGKAEEKAEEKTEEKAEEKAEEKPKDPEKPKEQEQDAPADSRPKVAAGSVMVSTTDATLNVMPSKNDRFLMSLTEGGMQYLLAGARTTVGLTSGRYMIEVKIVETNKQP